MNERLIQFLSAENISQAQFAKSINVAQAGVSHIISGRNKPSWDFIINTMNRYPALNIEWLLTGKGKMYKGSPSEGVDGASAVNSASNIQESPAPQSEEDTLFGNFGYTGTGKYGCYETELAQLDAMLHHLPRHVPEEQPSETSQPAPQHPTVSPTEVQPHAIPQPAPQTPPQTVVKKPNVAKVIVFFDDGTFQECK